MLLIKTHSYTNEKLNIMKIWISAAKRSKICNIQKLSQNSSKSKVMIVSFSSSLLTNLSGWVCWWWSKGSWNTIGILEGWLSIPLFNSCLPLIWPREPRLEHETVFYIPTTKLSFFFSPRNELPWNEFFTCQEASCYETSFIQSRDEFLNPQWNELPRNEFFPSTKRVFFSTTKLVASKSV